MNKGFGKNWLTVGVLLFLWSILVIPSSVVGECTCEEEEENEGGEEAAVALKYKITALGTILVAGAIGVTIPTLGKIKRFSALSPERDFFFLVKAFSGGVILSTAFIHVLPDAFEKLTSPCLKEHPWADFPFTGFVAMLSAIATLMVDSLATAYFGHTGNGNISQDKIEEGVDHVHLHTHGTHGHSHGSTSSSDSTQLLRHRIISQVLELGIVVHSVIIGISLGASESPKTIKPLIAALTFHQFFEGMGLGGCISQAKFNRRAVVTMAVFFTLTTPVGIAIGIGISNAYKENSPRALIVEGVMNATSSGILIYMSLVDLLAADFINSRVQQSGRLQFGAYTSLLLGAACMSILAKWA
ncbi:zinc transporter 5-like isoform X2 [Arachis ipaensis]|nr:zinc transporter 5-like isoform X2 [Arachis ipaensis]XP_020962468.1 zinc transporter 5-like isoform X2 [Arachis ipaensis]XP_025667127.1 zinc transporter 5 isoform X2 [Arachis hypogaea]QHO26374.1 Zinc transporter [Arachis hypogaea]